MPWWLTAILLGAAVAVAAELWWRLGAPSHRDHIARRRSELEGLREANRRRRDEDRSE